MSKRVEGIDVARGVASLIMIQGHAYHGWVAPDQRDAAYAFTRVLGTFPLPAFLVLAGAAVTWRVHAAAQRDENARAVRHSLLKRGAQVLLYGYMMSFSYALIDGYDSWHTLFRSDVLHVIGLSIMAGALCLGRTLDTRVLALRCMALAVFVTGVCAWVSDLDPPLGIITGLFIDAPEFTRMPFVPLFAWFGIGTLGAHWMIRARDESFASARAGAPVGMLVALTLIGIVAAIGGEYAFAIALGDDPASRAHPAIVLNVVDLAGRGWVILGLGALFSLGIPGKPRRALVRLGRGSLVAYVVHVPFCYGRLGGPLVGESSMAEASVALIALIAVSWASVYAWDAFKAAVRQRLKTSAKRVS